MDKKGGGKRVKGRTEVSDGKEEGGGWESGREINEGEKKVENSGRAPLSFCIIARDV